MANVNTGLMYLVYRDSRGQLHHQPWGDLVEAGTLTDPDSGGDMDMVGWSTS